MPAPTRSPLSSLFARMPETKSPEDMKVIEILDTDDDEDTKEQCSVKDSAEEIQEKKPAAKDPREVAIDNLCNELQEVFKLLKNKEKRKLSDAVDTPEAKKRKISDASEDSSRLKAPPTAVVSPTQSGACSEPKGDESCVECVEAELATTAGAASSDCNENSNFEALLKTAGEEQQRLRDTVQVDLTVDGAVQHEDLVDACMPAEASEVDGTPQADDYLSVESPQDPNCLAVEEAREDICPAVLPTREDVTVEVTTETVYEPDTAPKEEAIENEPPEEVDEPEDAVLFEYEGEETWDSPVNTRVASAIQWMKDILPPSFGSCLLFVCGLYCAYVDRSAAFKLALCLLVYCVNVGNMVVETETGDQPVFCVSLPANASKGWRTLVLSFYTIGFLGVLNLVSAFGEKIGDRILTKMRQA